uniref:Uncharacterized protein n=1 Tax=Anguilla anguilla TaxID=7936 RepID=A0A0E9V9F4_ANGAN
MYCPTSHSQHWQGRGLILGLMHTSEQCFSNHGLGSKMGRRSV